MYEHKYKYLLSILQYNNINESITSIERLYEILKICKTKNGNLYSTNTIRMLIYIFCKHHKITDYKLNPIEVNCDINDDLDMKVIRNTIFKLEEFISNPTLDKVAKNACIAVFCVLSFNLRSHEIAKLKYKHIKQILASKPITLNVKHHNKLPVLVKCNVCAYEKYKMYIKLKRHDEFLIGCSMRAINMYINSLYKWCFIDLYGRFPNSNVKLGLKLYRKYNTTLLYEQGARSAAVTFNRHADEQTTKTYYELGNNIIDTVKRELNE